MYLMKLKDHKAHGKYENYTVYVASIVFSASGRGGGGVLPIMDYTPGSDRNGYRFQARGI